jgi:hypothetical protein
MMLSSPLYIWHYLNIIIIPSPLPSPESFSPPLGFPIGLVAAKNKTLIAIAKAAWSASTTTRRILLVLASVVLSTGYKFLSRKNAENVKPRATKT